MARAMSISLKVVSMAVLCLDASSRSAMRLRMGVMGLRSSMAATDGGPIRQQVKKAHRECRPVHSPGKAARPLC
jgi:hypothetical protein